MHFFLCSSVLTTAVKKRTPATTSEWVLGSYLYNNNRLLHVYETIKTDWLILKERDTLYCVCSFKIGRARCCSNASKAVALPHVELFENVVARNMTWVLARRLRCVKRTACARRHSLIFEVASSRHAFWVMRHPCRTVVETFMSTLLSVPAILANLYRYIRSCLTEKVCATRHWYRLKQ